MLEARACEGDRKNIQKFATWKRTNKFHRTFAGDEVWEFNRIIDTKSEESLTIFRKRFFWIFAFKKIQIIELLKK